MRSVFRIFRYLFPKDRTKSRRCSHTIPNLSDIAQLQQQSIYERRIASLRVSVHARAVFFRNEGESRIIHE